MPRRVSTQGNPPRCATRTNARNVGYRLSAFAAQLTPTDDDGRVKPIFYTCERAARCKSLKINGRGRRFGILGRFVVPRIQCDCDKYLDFML